MTNGARVLVEVYDPPACCPGGACGPDIPPEVIEVFETFARVMMEHSDEVEVRRYFLPTDLQKVNEEGVLRERLIQWQAQDLYPVTLVDGEVVKTRQYASYEELLVLAGIASG